MPIQGLMRHRAHQIGRQSAFGTVVAAKRRYPFSGVPGVNLNWTDPEVDTGSLDPVIAPTRRAPELGADLTDNQLVYNNIPLLMCAFFGGGDTPSGAGTAKTWVTQPASLTADDLDLFTYEFGDDVTEDWYQLGDGILQGFTLTGPDDLGPITSSMDWVFGSVASTGATDMPETGTVPTPALAVDAHGIPVYMKDLSLYIDSAAGSLGGTLISDALHTFELRATQELDMKRFPPAPEFELSGYGRGARRIELALQFAKTDDTVGVGSESDAWMSDVSVDRFVRLAWESSEFAQTAGSPDIPYSWVIDLPLRYYTREEGNIGGNTTITLTGAAWLEEATLDFAFKSTAVTTLAAANF